MRRRSEIKTGNEWTKREKSKEEKRENRRMSNYIHENRDDGFLGGSNGYKRGVRVK